MSFFENLFSPINIGKMKLKNRIVLSPMATNYGTEKGQVTERQIQYYVERARGGVGLIVSESNYVSVEGRGGINRLGLCDDSQIPGHSKLTKALHEVGAPVCAQLHHGGVTVSMKAAGQYPVSCSAIPFLTRFGFNIPRRLSEIEIQDVVQSFSMSARRAKESGYDAVMIHAAHGYLINQFLSPRTNKRRDRYGGSDENRARFLIEVIESIRKNLGPAFPIMVRIPGEELLDNGNWTDFIRKVAMRLENSGVDEINVSIGNPVETEEASILAEGFLSERSAVIKNVVKIPVGVVGRILSPKTAEEILGGGKADHVYLGRALIADPEFAKKAEEGRDDEIRPCIACNKGCMDRLLAGLDVQCSTNATMGKEVSRRISLSERSRKVLIVGGGPAGLEAARVAAMRGHHVTLCEKSKELGGMLHQAAALPYKKPIARLIQYYIRQMELLGITVEVGKRVTSEMIRELQPDVLILALGAEPVRTALPGANLAHVFLAEDYLLGNTSFGQSVIILGGGLLGAELAEALVDQGKKVAIVEQLESVASEVGLVVKKELLKRLCYKGVKMLTNTKARAINNEGVIVERFSGIETLKTDTVILALGYKPSDEVQNIDVAKMEFYQIGDCAKPRTIMEAIEEGNRISFAI